ncbi:MAG TPA: response regulator [Ideonella sp.]|uniref:response regulator n=1 Tax=Ideonella sp. TaxID=1929293 RepID=UPI002E2FCCB4|nr:response regulator [Ideonella sp.]HEX5683508.1 response regulator [Ideonella sp.]
MSTQLPNSLRAIEILMVEDNPGDVRLTREALKHHKVSNELHVVEDGVAALDFLHRRPPYEQAPRPDLVLLDLNLPRKDGRQVLASIKSDELLKTIPVVILTTSQAEEDVVRAYKLNANCYVTKPVDFEQFKRIVQGIEQFWLTVVTLPPRQP